MNAQPDFNVEFSYPSGWVQLPTDSKRVLQRDKQLEKWAADKARAALGPDAGADQLDRRAGELYRLTMGARARKAWYGLAFFPPGVQGLIAILDVKRIIPDGSCPELTIDVLESIYVKQSADTVGDLETGRADLPSGPAVRVRGKQVEDRDPTGHGTIVEEVTYAIRPPGTSDAVIMQMSWTALQLGDHLAKMADAIAQTLKITPA